jgi:hypothetical protein
MELTIPPAESILRSALAMGAAALLWTGVAACSSSGSTTVTPTNNAQPANVSHTSAPAGTPASGSSATQSRSACGLVTVSEVTTATGKPMAAGNGAGNICSFSAAADPSLVVYVQIYPDAPSMATPKQAEPGSEHLRGLGDNAFWTAAGTVFVQKGNQGFSIAMPSLALTSRNAPPAIVALATAALARF